MKFGSYINAIKNSGIINYTKPKIVKDIFNAAGSVEEFSDSTAQKWIDGARTPKIKIYFPNEKIHYSDFIRYFRSHTQYRWHQLQYEFSLISDESLVDCHTNNMEDFYQSLLKQFLLLLNLPIPEDADINILLKNEAVYSSTVSSDSIDKNTDDCAFKDEEIISERPISLKWLPLPEEPLVIGRTKELERIEEIFETSNYAALTGIGGLGKSCIALKYAHNSLKKDEDLVVQHIMCEESESLRKAVARLEFIGLKDNDEDVDSKFTIRLNVLKTYEKSVLIILDNLNLQFTERDWSDL